MDLQLQGKVVVITGGSIGIGKAVAEEFAKEGVHLALCARNGERVRNVAQELSEKYGIQALGMACDVAKKEDIEQFIKEVAGKFQGVDILINNAGTGSAEKIMEAPDERWQYYWELHVMAAVRMSRAVVPLMQKRGGGVIINNASICARQPLDYEPIYNVTKAALAMFSKCLANELIPYNIRVNCVNPGLILTPDWYKTAGILSRDLGITPDEYLERIAREHTPIGRFAHPEELAKFFVFLASPCASYCVGSTYYVDGGWLKVVV